MKQKKVGMSRREFSRSLALIAATAAAPVGAARGKAEEPLTGQEHEGSNLSPEGEAQFQTILSRYGSRLSDEQKADVKRLVGVAQQTGKAMSSFDLENSNEPAFIFRVYTGEEGR